MAIDTVQALDRGTNNLIAGLELQFLDSDRMSLMRFGNWRGLNFVQSKGNSNKEAFNNGEIVSECLRWVKVTSTMYTAP